MSDVTRTQYSPAEPLVSRRARIARAVAVIGLATAVCLGVVLWNLPWLANHYNVALPTAHGLPFRIQAEGRTWLNHEMCAGATWCTGHPRCWTRDDLAGTGHSGLYEVGSVPTLFGQSHAIWRAASDGRYPYGLFVSYGSGCYLAYGLSGGW